METKVVLNGNEYHIQEIFFDIFKMALKADATIEDSSIQVIFQYWLKDKMGIRCGGEL